ncbi:MAG TPA: prolipoprotein diacylglyceryl transferase [Polyangia bacterium]|nr:prolipoprotein diacylglyceryl transferase [Polyangia bacterium]
MRPVLFKIPGLPLIGDLVFPAYFTLLLIGFAFALALSVRDARKLGMDDRRVYDLNLWMVFWGIVGSRVLHLIADGQWHDYANLCTHPQLVEAVDAKVSYCTSAAQCGYDYLCDLASHKCYPPKDCLAVLKLWRGGFAYYGGFLFASGFGLWYARRHQLGMWPMADLAGYGIPLGLFFGRMGCFFNGCCYGKLCTLPWKATFLRGGTAWRAQLKAGLIAPGSDPLPVHPTQLYEALGCLAIFVFCYYVIRPRKRAHGEVFAWFVALYAVLRFAIEFVRDDDRGIWAAHLSTSQLISIPLLAFAGWLFLRARGSVSRHAPGPV